MEWAEFFEKIENRRLALTVVGPGISVSTVFIGLDHNFTDKGPPLVFETMCFNDLGEEECIRWATWEQASAGHDRVVAEIRERLAKKEVKINVTLN